MYEECFITTLDNPFDYFEEFTSWNSFDVEKGYNTCSYVARLVELTDDMTQKEENEEVERIIDSIILNDPRPIYKKIRRTTNT